MTPEATRARTGHAIEGGRHVRTCHVGAAESDQVETFVSVIRDQVIPRAQNLPGFKGGYWLVDRSTGKGFGVTLFESEEALDASEAQANRIREEVSRGAGLAIPSFERYEVVASVGSAEERAA